VGGPESSSGLSCGLRQRFVLWVLLVVLADAVHEVVQVAGGEFPAERPGGLVVAVHEAQHGGGELSELAKSFGVTTFFWMTVTVPAQCQPSWAMIAAVSSSV